MEDTNTVELTELVSPRDPRIRHGLELKKQEYSDRLEDRTQPWYKEPSFQKRHDEYVDFRSTLYKHFLVKELSDSMETDGKVPVAWASAELEKTVGTVDEETLKNAFLTVRMYLTGELPLPNSAEIAASHALSPA